MKVGDLVKHFVDGAYGVVIRVDEIESYDYPYLVHWLDGGCDWFDPNAIKPVNESR